MVVAAAAVSLGVYADVGQRAPGALGALPELGTPWLLLAFAGGALCPRPRLLGSSCGAAVLLAGLTSYFVFVAVVHDVGYYNLTNDGRGTWWFGLAAVLGAGTGAVGTLTAHPDERLRTASWALLPALAAAEAERVVAGRIGPHPEQLAAVVVLSAVGLFAYAVLRTRRSLRTLAATVAWAAVGLVAAAVVARA